ncbi:hypothetical protein VTN49DRAFT_652 [Thermomyces lanuginosus]|uniref:uncharacterized protein n=1 Tax=Thermomyces lanuginosus TaxID=5541 RepID=UPI0037443796
MTSYDLMTNGPVRTGQAALDSNGDWTKRRETRFRVNGESIETAEKDVGRGTSTRAEQYNGNEAKRKGGATVQGGAPRNGPESQERRSREGERGRNGGKRRFLYSRLDWRKAR